VLPAIVVQASVAFAGAVLAEAALSYLGLGAQPPQPSWGSMLREAQDAIYTTAWPAVFPGLATAVTVLGLNLLGDALRDRLDPRLR
jgi:peptide/nickel transport system permease protein